jgi:RNA polymerase sigma-70 factor (ECF subfamily)
VRKDATYIELFRSFSKGDEKAFEQLYYLYFPRLYTFSFKILNDSGLAKDVVQNVFIKIWETRSVFNFDNPEAFVYQMVRNASLNYIRHLKVVDNLKLKVKDQYLGEELYYIDLVGNNPYILIEKELEERIQEVMESLPNRCLTVFRLSRLEGMKNLEIAVRLGISLKAVEKQISKALQIYRHNLADYLPLHIILLVLNNL